MIGRVTAFDAGSGLGSVADEAGRHYRFHCVEIADGTRLVDVGAAVEFQLIAKLGEFEGACLCKI